MLIILTGTIGSGKTTVCRQLIRRLRQSDRSPCGILTLKSATDQGHLLVEEISTGATRTLASATEMYHGPATARFSFSAEGIKFGLKAIRAAAGAPVTIIDELGQLELRGEGFANALATVTSDEFTNSILVIRSELLPAYLPKLPQSPLIFKVTASNRESLPETIVTALYPELSPPPREAGAPN
jgi:nucleoside-triphosphatase THEP1